MNSELNNQQSDWLAQTEELNDTEASQVNGGASTEAALAQQEKSSQESIQFQAEAAAITKETQQQITAINADRDLNTNAARNIGQAASQIK
jgi:hypothetical protein